jgi:hypothetical protein
MQSPYQDLLLRTGFIFSYLWVMFMWVYWVHCLFSPDTIVITLVFPHFANFSNFIYAGRVFGNWQSEGLTGVVTGGTTIGANYR